MAGRPRARALPHAGAPRQGGEEGQSCGRPVQTPLLPGSDLRYSLRVGKTAPRGSAVPLVARGGEGGGASPLSPSGSHAGPDAALRVVFWL